MKAIQQHLVLDPQRASAQSLPAHEPRFADPDNSYLRVSFTLGDLAIEAGRLIARGPDPKRSIDIASPFANAPIVLTSVKTADDEAVDSRVENNTVGSFSTAFSPPSVTSHTMDWIAVQEGSSTLKSGRTIEAFSSDVGRRPSVPFTSRRSGAIGARPSSLT